MAISTVDSNHLFVSYSGNKLYYSTNGGSSWNEPRSTDEKNADGWVIGSLVGNSSGRSTYFSGPIAAHPTNENVALTISDPAGLVIKTTDGGDNRRYSSDGNFSGRMGVGVVGAGTALETIRWHRGDPNKFIILLGDTGPFFTENGGSTFRRLKTPYFSCTNEDGKIIGGGYTTYAGDWGAPDYPDLMITTSGRSSGVCQQIVVTRNLNSANPNWTVISSLPISKYRYIALHPTNRNIAYANNYKFINLITGNSYIKLSKYVDAMYSKNGDIVYSTEGVDTNGDEKSDVTRIYKSTKQGDNGTWINPYPDLPFSITNVGQIAIHPSNPNIIYVAVDSGIYKLNGIGTGWELINGVAPNKITKGSWQPSLTMAYVAIDPNNPNILYAADRALAGNGIFRSNDSGKNWFNITNNLNLPFGVWSIIVNPSNSYVYIGSGLGTWKLPPP